MEENHYVPDETARSLVTNRTRAIGLLTDDLNSRHQNEAIARCLNELVVHGYQGIFRYIGADSRGMERAIAELNNRKVEGVLLFGLSFTDHERVKEAIVRWLPDVPVILVYQNERIDMDNVYCIGANERKGFCHCVERLMESGRRNLALMIEKNRASRVKIRGYFEDAMKDYPEADYRVYTDIAPGAESAKTAVERMLADLPKLDGVICTQDRLGIEVMYALKERGFRVPEDVSVVGEGNAEVCEVCRPMLTSMDTMVDVCAIMSVRMLLDVLEGRTQPYKIVFEMELVERGSL
ncbi:MAG: LacI family transcriptional regulator [Clostridiales bacterium]|nr:LacI family transcriptional regulator [Clostridiales bacterium]